jgi:hypothetical protein
MSPKARVFLTLSWVVGGCADDISESMVSLSDSSGSSTGATTTITVTTTEMTADTSSGSQTVTTDMTSTTGDTDATTATTSDATTTTTSPTTDGSTSTGDATTTTDSSTTDATTTTGTSTTDASATTTDTTGATTTDATTTGGPTTTDVGTSTGGPECFDDLGCDDALPCTLDQCSSGSCENTPLDGVVAPSELQTSGDCQIVNCTMGSPSSDIDDTDLPVDGDACTDDVCSDGSASNPPANSGVTCPTGVCDGAGSCVECLAPDDCNTLPPDDDCQTRTCIANACGQSFTTAGTAVTNQIGGDCLEVVCDGAGGSGPQNDDTDVPVDGLECTDDVCTDGVGSNPDTLAGTTCAAGVCDGMGGCVGCLVPADCNGTDTFCQTITCDMATCGVDNTPAGTSLPAPDQTVACQTLECDGNGGVQGTPLPENTDCSDGLFCNGGDLCDATGSCVHGGSPCAASQVCGELADACRQPPWINEFHYDNAGADSNEFVEVAIADGIDINTVTLWLYNGSGGVVYNTGGSVNGQLPLSGFTVGATVNGITFYSRLVAGLQNGAPDGFALDVGGTLIEFISYEGSFAGVGGVANGVNSTDIGIAEEPAPPAGSSLGRIGNGNQASDFTWAVIADDNAGAVNSGQTITP